MFENFSKAELARRTFLFDNCRCFCAGILELLFNNIALVILIRVFGASMRYKGLLTAAWCVGNFLTSITQTFAAKSLRFTTMNISKMYMFAVAAVVLTAAMVSSMHAFFVLIVLATILFKQPIPLIADVYGQNYSAKERGKRLSIVLMVIPLPIIMFSKLCGRLLDMSLQNYRLFLLVAAIAAIVSGIALGKIPARILPSGETRSIFANFGIIFKDKLFAMMLLWWAFTGVANQMTKPLRVEYLANSAYGINATNAFEALACISIPCFFRLISSLLWGRLFDRSRVIILKLLINVFLAIGLWLFFFTKNEKIICLASALIGIAYGGGEVALCLWVTRIAPRAKFSAYMSANIAVVGLVGLISPFIGYTLLRHLPFKTIAWVAGSLVLLSSIGFLSLFNHPRFANELEK
jgi:predicted MFS family arabinose efflux permease